MDSLYAKLMKEADDMRTRLGARNIFLFIFEPEGKNDQVVCGGNLDLDSGLKLLKAIQQLHGRLVSELKVRAKESPPPGDDNHLSN